MPHADVNGQRIFLADAGGAHATYFTASGQASDENLASLAGLPH